LATTVDDAGYVLPIAVGKSAVTADLQEKTVAL
jgi:hypothetical protein